MKKLSLLLLAVLLVALTGCGEDAATLNGDNLTRMATSTVESSVITAVAASGSKSGTKGVTPLPLDVNWTNLEGTVHVEGTVTYTGETNTYSMTVTFTAYTGADETDSYTLSGTVTYNGSMTSSTKIFNYIGDLDVLFGGETHEYLWNIALTMDIDGDYYAYHYTGNYTLDGTDSSYSYSWWSSIHTIP